MILFIRLRSNVRLEALYLTPAGFEGLCNVSWCSEIIDELIGSDIISSQYLLICVLPIRIYDWHSSIVAPGVGIVIHLVKWWLSVCSSIIAHLDLIVTIVVQNKASRTRNNNTSP